MSTTRPMRRVLACVLIALCLTAAGCTAPSKASGQLVVGVTSYPDNLHPWKATQFQAVEVLQNIYGTLTEFDSDSRVRPSLATDWQSAQDGKKLTLTLREGVTFADGSALDSADVKSSLDAIKDPDTAAVGATNISSVKKVSASGPHTVELHLNAPDSALPSNLATVNMAILSSHDNGKELTAKPNGTGPYQFLDSVSNQWLRLEKNPRYWGEPASLEQLEFRVIPDEDSILVAMQAGNVQFAVFDSPLVATSAEATGLNVARTPQTTYHALQLNADRPALRDVNARLAVQCAIDRQEVLDTAGFGEGEIIGPLTSPHYRSDPDDRPCPERDLDQAARYLDKAGVDSLWLEAIVSQGQYATSVDEAQNVKAQLADANITLDLEILESGSFVEEWSAADYDAAIALNGAREDPDGSYGRYFTSDGNLNNVAGYDSKRLDELFAAGRATTDAEERARIYQDIGAELEDKAAWVWLFSSYSFTATTSEVSGFEPLPSGSLQYLRTTTVD